MFRAVHNVPFSIPAECDTDAVECLDASGRPLLVTPRPQRTGLVRAMAGVQCRAPGRRIHARRMVPVGAASTEPLAEASTSPAVWTLAAVGPVQVGEAREDAVWRLLLADAYWQTQLAPFVLPELLPLRTLEPAEAEVFFPVAQFGLTRLHLYQMRVPVKPAADDDHLWLDPQEVQGLEEQFSDMFSPLLRFALTLLPQK